MNDTDSQDSFEILKTNAIIFLILDFILALAALLANCIFMITLIKQRTLHTPSNMLLGALCSSDLFIVLVVQPLYWADFWQRAQQIQSDVNRAIEQSLEDLLETSLGISFTLVIFICLDRYFAICYPHDYDATVTCKTHLYTAVISAIAVTSLFRLSLFFLRTGSNKTYLGTLYYVRVIRYILPFTLILFCYTRIYGVILKRRRVQVAIRDIADTAAGNRRSNLRRNKEEEIKAGTVAIILVCFYICYGPNFVIALLDLDQVANIVAIIWADFMLFASSLINPVIYYTRSTEIRNACKRTISLCRTQREATGN